MRFDKLINSPYDAVRFIVIFIQDQRSPILQSRIHILKRGSGAVIKIAVDMGKSEAMIRWKCSKRIGEEARIKNAARSESQLGNGLSDYVWKTHHGAFCVSLVDAPVRRRQTREGIAQQNSFARFRLRPP